MFRIVAGLAASLLMASNAQAAGPTVSAEDPNGIVSVLELAGYEAELDVDTAGDPMIITELGGWEARILFYGCDENTHDGCDSLQFLVGFDRANPWTAEEAMRLSSQYRYTSIWLDEEGDPFIQWDVVTADGIPTKVFLRSVREFTQAITNATNLIFAEENEAQEE